MIRAEQIPDEVVEAALHAYDISFKNDYTTGEQDIVAAIAAALNAWPGGQVRLSMFTPQEEIILPLPQEVTDDV
jgi:hypothetical protein